MIREAQRSELPAILELWLVNDHVVGCCCYPGNKP